MGVNVLVSIHPQHVERIVDGTKTVELRRKFPDVEPGTLPFIHSTNPVGKIVGFSPVLSVDRMRPAELWAKHGTASMVSREHFDKYFEGREVAIGVVLGKHRSLGPVCWREIAKVYPGFRPPQSYRYVDVRLELTIWGL